jgi:MYXO-CTERM domain-containing protein
MVRFASRYAAPIALSLLTPLTALADAGGSGGTIVGGGPTSGDPAVAAVLAFDENDQITSTCTGTLIGPDVILTAGHCVDDPATAGYLIWFGTVVSEDDPGFVFATFAVSAVAHPGWDGTIEGGDDIGIIRTADEVPLEPIPVNTRAIRSSDVGDPVRLVGWGITGGGANDEGIKRAVVSRLDDYDAELVQVGNPDTNTCSGDSGGPAFMTIDGTEVVVGVTSFGDADCTIAGFSTRADAFLDFIAREGDLDLPIEDPDDDDDDDDDDNDDDDGDIDADGGDGGGCSAGTGAGRGSFALVAVVALALVRRRRRR